MELEFHKKRYYRDLKHHYRAPYGAIKLKKNLHVLKYHNRILKCHYRAPYGAIKLKKNLHVLKCYYRTLINCMEGLPMEPSNLKKKLACFKVPL